MKKLFGFLSVILFASFLFGCSPVYKKTYSYQPPVNQTGKMCTAQCMQNKNMCQQMCQMRSENCVAQARAEANARYQAYHMERVAKNLPDDKSADSFDDSYFRCNSMKACDCTNDFNICYANCGGSVQPHTVCTAFCDKK